MNKLATWILLSSLALPAMAREGCNKIQDYVLDRMEKLHIPKVDWEKIVWCSKTLWFFYNNRTAPFAWVVDTQGTIAVCRVNNETFQCAQIWKDVEEWVKEFENIYLGKTTRNSI